MNRLYQLYSGLILVFVFLVVGFLLWPKPEVVVVQPEPEPEVAEEEMPFAVSTVIGTSVEGRNIEATTYGSGDTHLLLVGGIHGGYEWNSSILA